MFLIAENAHLRFLFIFSPTFSPFGCILSQVSPHQLDILASCSFKMNSPKQPKHSLPSLITEQPLARQSTGSLPVLPSNVPADPIVQEPSQPEKQAVAPFLFQRNEDKEETVASLPEPETTKSKSISVADMNISQDAPAARSAAKKMFSEDEFANQASQSSPNDQVARDALVVAELSTNCKVCPQLRVC